MVKCKIILVSCPEIGLHIKENKNQDTTANPTMHQYIIISLHH